MSMVARVAGNCRGMSKQRWWQRLRLAIAHALSVR